MSRPPEPTDRELSLKLFVVLSKASRNVMDFTLRNSKQSGLSPTEFAVLELLYHKGSIPLQQIGGKILITSGSITYNIDKLEKKGYLKRVPCLTDRRVTYAELTDEGRKLLDEIFPVHSEVIDSIMAVLSREEKEAAIGALKKIGLEAQSRS